MIARTLHLFVAGVVVVLAFACTCSAGGLSVVSTTPARHTISAPANTDMVINFDRPVDLASATSQIHVYGRYSGLFVGNRTLENGDTSLRLSPAQPFPAGETVLVIMSDQLTAQDASTLRAEGYAYQFWIETAPCTLVYSTVEVADLTGPAGFSPRPYGGSATDMNEDGSTDIVIINEDSSDLRVMINMADGTGMFQPYLQPTTPVGAVPSPNISGDLNGDGHMDVVTANTSGSSVSVALGTGTGTFSPRTDYTVGSTPKGIALLDSDGDGDLDIATANNGSNNLSLLKNNGNGTFIAAVNFDSGGNGEYGLDAADMNNDGIFDLVVGTTSQQMCVMLGNGNGTFSAQPIAPAGGFVWMIVLADMNADGNMDATTCNGPHATGSVILGNGTGGFGAPAVHNATSTAVATDVADLDGDGDLDWLLSSFGGGVWRLFTNNGTGVMTLDQSTQAVANPACALILDVNNDRKMDLALIDEIADIVTIKKNVGSPVGIPGDLAKPFGQVDVFDLFVLLGNWGTSGPGADLAPPTNVVNVFDLFVLLGNWG